tara:strand:+ start:1091 stop:1483 length:393 start_codon:yes stop_codon:yes gene_type:complete
MSTLVTFKALTCVVNHQLCPQMKELMKENVKLKKKCKKAVESNDWTFEHIYCEMCEEWTDDFCDYSKELKICDDCMYAEYLYCDGCDKMKKLDNPMEIMDCACDCSESFQFSTEANGAVCNDCCKCRENY